jgi:flagellin-like protein
MKKGVTPIISTVLLVMIAVVIAVIILIWYLNFQGEQLLKFDMPIDTACSKVMIEPYINSDKTTGYKNKGNIPVYGINLKMTDVNGNTYTKKITGDEGGKTNIGDVTSFLTKTGTRIDYYTIDQSTYSEIKFVPILYGKTSSGIIKEYECIDAYGVLL